MALRILVIDDDTALAEMIGLVLEADGFAVDLCEDGARALEREKAFAKLNDWYPVTVGNVTAVRSAERYGREMGEALIAAGVEGVILTST